MLFIRVISTLFSIDTELFVLTSSDSVSSNDKFFFFYFSCISFSQPLSYIQIQIRKAN